MRKSQGWDKKMLPANFNTVHDKGPRDIKQETKRGLYKRI